MAAAARSLQPDRREKQLDLQKVSKPLKAPDTFGNCQRAAFSLGISNMHKKVNKSCKRMMKEKNNLIAKIVVLSNTKK